MFVLVCNRAREVSRLYRHGTVWVLSG